MNKQQMLNVLSKESGVSRADVDSVLNAFSKVVQTHVIGEDNVIRIGGLGSFKRRDRAARIGRNPHTGEPVSIPAKSSIAFKASTSKKNKS